MGIEIHSDAFAVTFTPTQKTGGRILKLSFEVLDKHMQRLECVSFAILPPDGRKAGAITTTVVRKLNVASLIDDGRRALLSGMGGGPDPDSKEMLDAAEKELARTQSRRTRIGAEDYVRVVEVYTRARNDGDPPTKAVQEAFGVSYSRAAKLVTRARELKLLTWAGPGKPSGTIHYGEATMSARVTGALDPTLSKGKTTKRVKRATPKKASTE